MSYKVHAPAGYMDIGYWPGRHNQFDGTDKTCNLTRLTFNYESIADCLAETR